MVKRGKVEMLLDLLKSVRDKPGSKYMVRFNARIGHENATILLDYALKTGFISIVESSHRFSKVNGFKEPSGSYYMITDSGRMFLHGLQALFKTMDDLYHLMVI